MKLDGKIIVLTGASAGMGRAMAKRFAQEGAKVVAVARRAEVLQELADEAKEEGCAGEIIPYAGDCSKEDVCEGMIKFAVEKYGKLDVLVNNAGIMDDTTAIGDFGDDYLKKIFDLDTFGVFYAMRAAVKQYLTQEWEDPDMGFRGSILNISSIGAQHSCAGVVYCAAKSAVETATKHTAFMYAKDGIQCNAIAPGGIITDIFMNMPLPDEFGAERNGVYTPAMCRLGNAEEVANVAAFLASDESSYINGQILPVNGGWLCF